MSLAVERRADPRAVERILRALPQWFGIEEAIQNYVARAEELDCFLAVSEAGVVGVALVERHFPESAELALIAVDPQHRSRGVGAKLIDHIERALRVDGCRFLEVHTVGQSYEHDGYAETRAFYKAVGFARLHEFENVEWDGPTLVYIKSL